MLAMIGIDGGAHGRYTLPAPPSTTPAIPAPHQHTTWTPLWDKGTLNDYNAAYLSHAKLSILDVESQLSDESLVSHTSIEDVPVLTSVQRIFTALGDRKQSEAIKRFWQTLAGRHKATLDDTVAAKSEAHKVSNAQSQREDRVSTKVDNHGPTSLTICE
jgi:hypothetical protein